MLLVMVDWRMSRNMSRMEWMLMGFIRYVSNIALYISCIFIIIHMYLMCTTAMVYACSVLFCNVCH